MPPEAWHRIGSNRPSMLRTRFLQLAWPTSGRSRQREAPPPSELRCDQMRRSRRRIGRDGPTAGAVGGLAREFAAGAGAQATVSPAAGTRALDAGTRAGPATDTADGSVAPSARPFAVAAAQAHGASISTIARCFSPLAQHESSLRSDSRATRRSHGDPRKPQQHGFKAGRARRSPRSTVRKRFMRATSVANVVPIREGPRRCARRTSPAYS
jgi:hypothetical protein